jgi:hypothetical protein
MHRIHAQISGAAARVGPAPLADGDGCGPGQLERGGLIAVARAGAQVVQMRHADLRYPLVLLMAELLVLALQNPAGGRSA